MARLFIRRALRGRPPTDHPQVRQDFLSIEIAAPPIGEQRKIAGIFDIVRRAIEQQEHLLALTAELKNAILHRLLTYGLHHEPQKQTEMGPVPESWHITDLGEVVSLFGGYAFKSEEAITTSNTQLVRMGNLYQNQLDLNRSPIFYPDEFAKKYSRFVLHPGDLIMSLTGTTGKEDYGFTVKVPAGQKTLLLNQRVARVEIISDRLTKEYLLYFLFRTLLHHLMTARIRTQNVDLPELHVVQAK